MVTVRLFGTLRLDSGIRSLRCEAKSVKELRPLVVREIRRSAPSCPVSEQTLRACLVAVNGQKAGPRTKLRDGDEVCFFPAMAGG